ncbi:squalene-hopene cyclase [Synechococcus sp. PCC 7502]|uniref:squalene--hopene cyclase n=1 Tax=Synechococcus sp. PCC 7502 TaxID=1173263 RepID=UPI00029FEDF5|nr:squalene--hopene cyclase [Synechococcus sp. PCC 7502]AFY75324.1 squalene-hopene cyclase [Synechococcus sp. PCC 7502]
MQALSTKNLKNLVTEAIAKSQAYLLSLQDSSGYWWAELESNVTITAETVLLHKIWGSEQGRNLHKVETYLRAEQRNHGGWELFYGDGGDLSTSVEAYMALRLLGVVADDPALIRAKEFILARGGITKTRIFTKMHLALIGCYNWKGLPSIPPWVILLPDAFPFNIYEMSSWARGSTVPLLIVFDRKPVYNLNPQINLNELYSEGFANVKYQLPRNSDWTDIFVNLDDLFKIGESLNLVPFREEGIKASEKWILERQEATGDWGGIIPAMLNSMLGLKALDYDLADPVIVRGMAALDRFVIETADFYRVQPCVSPVWDTALVMRSLIDSGMSNDDPHLVKAGEWLIEKQILDYGDWAVKNKQGKPGAWAFEFDNRFYPDVDDTAVVVMALCQVQLPTENLEDLKWEAIARSVAWISTMQCKAGGWAAFDLDNDQDWLNLLPYADLKAMIDPNTADVTARVLEMIGYVRRSLDSSNQQSNQKRVKKVDKSITSWQILRALNYLQAEQEAEGCWFGRWGVNYIYGTSGVLAALAGIAADSHTPLIKNGATWLISCQNPDGGWGETCRSYNDPSLKGQGVSTASQTGWAVIGLLAAGEATGNFAWDQIDKGIEYLVSTQRSLGDWYEAEFTGTGFPCHFYLKYHLYQQHFSLTALGRYLKAKTNYDH